MGSKFKYEDPKIENGMKGHYWMNSQYRDWWSQDQHRTPESKLKQDWSLILRSEVEIAENLLWFEEKKSPIGDRDENWESRREGSREVIYEFVFFVSFV